MSLDLGKYAVTVLTAWGATLILLVAIILQSLSASIRARRALEAEEAASSRPSRSAPERTAQAAQTETGNN